MTDTLLPHASILERLMQSDPNAGDWIMDRTDDIQKRFHEKQIQAQKRFNPKASMDDFTYILGGSSRLSQKFLSETAPPLPFEQGLEMVGDYLRAAIKDYCQAHKVDLKTLGLTPEEDESLNMKNPAHHAELNFPLP